jgi:two-component system, chemotaxis family, protein-glutamate methylesterase/glutaminase
VTGGARIALIVSGASPPSRPSDLLLTTLATACRPRAAAVVLSGGGHAGATGATAIHRLGGTMIAPRSHQRPESSNTRRGLIAG